MDCGDLGEKQRQVGRQPFRKSHAVEMVLQPRKYPFTNMRIGDHSVLDSIEGRSACSVCARSRKFFCYTCLIPVGELGALLPTTLDLPVDIDIIKHQKEIDGKSTAVHAAILAKERVRIYTYPDIPDYTAEAGVVLAFPGTDSVTVAQLFGRKVHLQGVELAKGMNPGTLMKRRLQEVCDFEEEDVEPPPSCGTYTRATLPIRKVVFIDSTWNQSRGVYKDARVNCLPTIVLQHRLSQFWRHQSGSPRWYLATIEAVHQLLLELHVNAWGLNRYYRGLDQLEISAAFHEGTQLIDSPPDCVAPTAPYNGHYDPLLFFFANMYDLIHKYYDHRDLKSYRRPIN